MRRLPPLPEVQTARSQGTVTLRVGDLIIESGARHEMHAATIVTSLRHYLGDLRAIAHGPYYRQRPPHDFGRSMQRRVLAGELWAVRRALRDTR